MQVRQGGVILKPKLGSQEPSEKKFFKVTVHRTLWIKSENKITCFHSKGIYHVPLFILHNFAKKQFYSHPKVLFSMQVHNTHVRENIKDKSLNNYLQYKISTFMHLFNQRGPFVSKIIFIQDAKDYYRPSLFDISRSLLLSDLTIEYLCKFEAIFGQIILAQLYGAREGI